jgi:hypothetical protein
MARNAARPGLNSIFGFFFVVMIAGMSRGALGFGHGRLPANRRAKHDPAEAAHGHPVKIDSYRPVVFEPSDAAFEPAPLLRFFAFLLKDEGRAVGWFVFLGHGTGASLGLREMVILLRIVIVVKPAVVAHVVVAAIEAHHFQRVA